MNRWTTLLSLILLLLVGGIGTLAWLQNSTRSTELSLNLGFAAWQLAEPIAIPSLVGAAVGTGMALGALPFLVAWQVASARARRLERQIALSGSGWSAPGGPTASPDRPDDGWK